MDYLKEIKDEDDRLSDLTKRMDDDVALARAKYVMEDDKEHKIPDIVNVTLNKLSLFAAFATSELSKAVLQAVVTTEEKKLDTTYIEDFQRLSFESADDRLRRNRKPQLNPFFDVQNCYRGRSSALCAFQMEKDESLTTCIEPWDSYYVRFGKGTNGDWASYGSGLECSKNDIESQDWAIEKGFTISGKTAKPTYVWDTEGNYIYIDNKLVYEQEHSFGFCPVCIQIVPLGYGAILLDKDSAKYEGESIFFLIRDLVPELNRVISISQTLNLKSVKAPLIMKVKGAATRKLPKHVQLSASGAVVAVEPDESIGTLEYGDIRASFDRAYNILEKAIQEGSLTNVDMGDPRQPFSAVALIQIGETRGQVLLPRLVTKSLMKESLAEMFTRQVIDIGGSVEIGTLGHKRTFDTGKLKGEYSTEYKYFIKSPAVDAGLYSLAAAAGNSLPDKYKREHIYQLQDPAGVERQLRWEEAERLSPAIKMRRTIQTLIEMDEDAEADLLLSELDVSLQQMLTGEAKMPKPEEEQKPKQVVSMFGGGGRPRQTKEE